MLAKERLPFCEHIVSVEKHVSPPDYVKKSPLMDLSTVYASDRSTLKAMNVMETLPESPLLDMSQVHALKRVLSASLALIQGPPGTGKTYLSVAAIRILLTHRCPGEAPILIASHTNHALDQLLRHIAEFEPQYVRLGAQSTDESVKKRTLHEIKTIRNHRDPNGCLRGPALRRLRQITGRLRSLLTPLTVGSSLLRIDTLKSYNLLSAAQCESLAKGLGTWIDLDAQANNQEDRELHAWLGDEKCMHGLVTRMKPDNFDRAEEDDVEFEQLQELEAEGQTLDYEDRDTLRGEVLLLQEIFTGRKKSRMSPSDIRNELKKDDLYDVPEQYRGAIYRYLQTQLKERIRAEVRKEAAEYSKEVNQANVGRSEADYSYLREGLLFSPAVSKAKQYSSAHYRCHVVRYIAQQRHDLRPTTKDNDYRGS